MFSNNDTKPYRKSKCVILLESPFHVSQVTSFNAFERALDYILHVLNVSYGEFEAARNV